METRRILRDLSQIAAAVIVAALLLRFFVIGAIRISSPSMEPTLQIGDAFVVNKLAYLFGEPRRGDIIVFEFPFAQHSSEVERYVKRCIACAGDTIRVTQGRVFVNGREALLPGSQSPARQAAETAPSDGEVRIIPPGEYYVLGDNRENSSDSRSWGLVPRRSVIGRATLIYWSRAGGVVRWNRLGTLVR